ncbi:MAG TPA: GDSL-type esterase/lipase family protein [Sedimentisphaerales bacterium]|nr:GDSL-type esterase/lipase family protein [Sedimentisphaerales bacterium]HRS11147.1 GDSL-type esterase/lipase family protein [Sedimentisphaerales bacterium]HRV47644.1 GDSL-type esterase/lipase family protein [Sedimentisphaerales bacterium]
MSVAGLMLLSLLSVFTVAQTSVPAADPDPNRFAKEIDAFEQWDSRNAFPAEPVLFVGSSSIRMWRTREGFPDLPVINRGFGGSHISDVLYFFDRIVLPYRPKVIVFYAGDNDVAGGKPAERVLGDYCQFVDRVAAALPRTHVVFVTIKPSGQRWALWPEMHKANNLVRELCERNAGLFFADLASPLLDSRGQPDDSFFLADRLHLNAQGYAVWNKALAPILKQALASFSTGADDR